MLDVKVDRNSSTEKLELEAEGTLEEILNDLGNVVQEIYGRIRDDQEAADAFRWALQILFEDDSPVWKTREKLKEGGGKTSC